MKGENTRISFFGKVHGYNSFEKFMDIILSKNPGISFFGKI